MDRCASLADRAAEAGNDALVYGPRPVPRSRGCMSDRPLTSLRREVRPKDGSPEPTIQASN